MTDHHLYGTSAHTAGERARLVGDRLGVVFTKQGSDYRGVYHLAGSPGMRIEIQPNVIPGDDDLYAPGRPTARVLLLATTLAPGPALQARLCAIDGLHRLSRTDSL